MQLIRLGDASNFSHGRNSASTLDDGFSRVAEVSSSAGASSDGVEVSDAEDEDDLPPRERVESSPMLPPGVVKKHYKNLDDILPSCDSTDPSSDDADGDYHYDKRQTELKSEYDDNDPSYGEHKAKRTKMANSMSAAKPHGAKQSSSTSKVGKSTKNRANAPASRKSKSASAASNNTHKVAPAAPPSVASSSNSRKMSSSNVNFQYQLAADEEDLSTKPRCQRCRKSKKGCDRQRPCGRCRDAGIGIEGCISEDEGNGRKGRYGRHMGVPVKKTAGDVTTEIHPPMPLHPAVATSSSAADKNKKRKR